MNQKSLRSLVAGALAATLAVASPALAFRGGGGGFGGHMGGGGFGGHMGGMGGGMHGMGGGMGMRSMGGGIGMHPGGIGGPRFGGAVGGTRFAGAPFAARAAFTPGFSRGAFHRHAFFHHRFNRFAFFGAPLYFAAYGYDTCWRRVWTGYGLRWINVCGDYGYGYY